MATAAPAAFAVDAFLGLEAGGILRNHIPVVDKRVFLEAQVDEGGLQTVLQILDFALEDAADNPVLAVALDEKVLEFSFLENHHARLEAFLVDHDLFFNFSTS